MSLEGEGLLEEFEDPFEEPVGEVIDVGATRELQVFYKEHPIIPESEEVRREAAARALSNLELIS